MLNDRSVSIRKTFEILPGIKWYGITGNIPIIINGYYIL